MAKIIIAKSKAGHMAISQSYVASEHGADFARVLLVNTATGDEKEFKEPIIRTMPTGFKDQPCSGLAFQAATMAAIKWCDETHPKMERCWERVTDQFELSLA